MPPSRPESALAKALDAHRAGRLDDAERDYRAVLKREPTQLDALYLLGLLLHQSGRSREALVPLERAVTRAPHRAEFLNSLGDAHRTLGEFDAAETRLREALTVPSSRRRARRSPRATR